MKRFIVLILMLVLLLAACGGGETAPATTAAPTTEALAVPTLAPQTEAPTIPTQLTTEAPTEPVTEPTTEPTEPTEPTLSPAEQARLDFYTEFWELDPEDTDAWLSEHPEYFSGDYSQIAVNQAWLSDKGLDLETTQGDQVLAIDAANHILIVRIWPSGSRGVLAIAKDPSRLHLFPAKNLGVQGERIGSIAERNNGLLAMTGSGFLDEGGNGNGGQLAGYCKCGGVEYGTPMGWNYARFCLTESNWAYVSHADGGAGDSTTDAMEFEPAILIEGELQDPGIWNGENPRACIGQTSRGDILMLGVEGRFSDSPGCPVDECGRVMLRYDGWNAINVDGGTTAIVWYRGEPIMRCSNRSTPQGRYLPNAWVYTR